LESQFPGYGDAVVLRTALRMAVISSPAAFLMTIEDIESQPANFWQEALLASSWAVVERRGAVLGIARTQPPDREIEPDADPTEIRYIDSLWIAPAMRRRGLGTHLVEFLIETEMAANPALQMIQAAVLESNVPATYFYDRMGFFRAAGTRRGGFRGAREVEFRLALSEWRGATGENFRAHLRQTGPRRLGVTCRLLRWAESSEIGSASPETYAVRTRKSAAQSGESRFAHVRSLNSQLQREAGHRANPAKGEGVHAAAPPLSANASPRRGHVFVSYVREDSTEVALLQHALESAGIQVWRDTADLWPGDNWRAKIRDAITHNALVFVACFSSHSVTRKQSYQNEELALAVEQLRLRQPDDPWLIPVRFSNCEVPDVSLGFGRTLGSIQRADLFGPHRKRETSRLVKAIERILQ
jgi:ribosomal protein S18 acetylase RimI-like enzyme